MRWRQWTKKLSTLLRPGLGPRQSAYRQARGQVTHVLILDGTMSTLRDGCESNAGLTYKLLSEVEGANLSVYYEAGPQWHDWRNTQDVILGRGINRQIRRAYGYLASRYREGDKILLLGYSRGAFAVRSLAGVIDRMGLLCPEHATERNIRTAYRHYQCSPGGEVAKVFRAAYCRDVDIEMVGVWDTVKALGLRLPLLWKWTERAHAFHDHRLGHSVKHGYHALALHETRQAFAPEMWETPAGFEGKIEQVWFRGCHGDVGGQLSGCHASRPLANIPLVWMLERAAECGLKLPEGWQQGFPVDVAAPPVGSWQGWGKLFLLRSSRRVGFDSSERLHESVVMSNHETGMAEGLV